MERTTPFVIKNLVHSVPMFQRFLDRGENFVFCPAGACWIELENRKLEHNKTKLVSIIASAKKKVKDHFKRHELIEKHKDRNILVLCKRLEQIQLLLKILKDKGENVDYMDGEKLTFDNSLKLLFFAIVESTFLGLRPFVIELTIF